MTPHLSQLNLEFTTHHYENNSESQKYLDENRERLNKQCKRVYDILMIGERLTVRGAMVDHNIMSLPRRILDLKRQGIVIQESTEKGSGIKTWWIEK